MTYLKKPRWIDSDDEDRPFPAVFKPTREERETAKPVQFSGKDDSEEHASDLPHFADDFNTPEDRVMIAAPDPRLDEPEWGTAKSQPAMRKRKDSVQSILDTEQ